MKQKDIFLESEANAWFARNSVALSTRKLPDCDPLLMEILRLPEARSRKAKILEIGCSDGTRLAWLKENLGFECHGLEPSAQAVQAAQAHGIAVRQGTAEQLPFEDRQFDIVMFGFCLYLCDREDLFQIAYQADRVLRSPGWMLILDFYSPAPVRREYHHRAGIYSYKMDYSSLFAWNPAFTSFAHTVRHHAEDAYTDDPQEWVATSVLRKNPL